MTEILQNQPKSVSEYIAQVNRVLASAGGRIKGEVISVKVYPRAVYFDIKDDASVLSCTIWASTYRMNGIDLKAGDEVIVTGVPNVYAPYGKLSLITDTIEYAGEGALKQAYDRLKAQLEDEGLLSRERKRSLPEFPRKIGLITSLKGVVIQDFSTNLSRHGFKITTIDSRVEGKDAIHELLASINTMAKQDIDVLVVIRGGGSLESLQAFNTESVVRAIAGFKVPVITGIGHDVDKTLSQLVADIGVSTPTAVEEALNQPWDGLLESLSLQENKILNHFRTALRAKSGFLTRSANSIFRTYERRLSDARSDIGNASTRVMGLFHDLSRRVRDVNSALMRAVGIMKTNLRTKGSDLRRQSSQVSDKFHKNLVEKDKSIMRGAATVIQKQKTALRDVSKELPVLERAIKNNDPMRNIKLGYSLSYVNGKLARRTADITTGELITTKLLDGEFTSEVKEVK